MAGLLKAFVVRGTQLEFEAAAVKKCASPTIDRRGLLRVLTVGAGAAAAAAPPLVAAAAETTNAAKKSRAQYHANSPEVQTFYRVNRYPAK
jgi:hypothetical protein